MVLANAASKLSLQAGSKGWAHLRSHDPGRNTHRHTNSTESPISEWYRPFLHKLLNKIGEFLWNDSKETFVHKSIHSHTLKTEPLQGWINFNVTHWWNSTTHRQTYCLLLVRTGNKQLWLGTGFEGAEFFAIHSLTNCKMILCVFVKWPKGDFCGVFLVIYWSLKSLDSNGCSGNLT